MEGEVMKNNGKRRTYVISLIMLSLILFSCDLFQLRPAARDNPLDPSSAGFTFPDRSWEAPFLLETDDSGDANYPQVAFDSSGNAMAVWQQSDNIMARHYTPAGQWDTTQPIETAVGAANKPQVAFDSAGNAIAVWYQSDGSYNNIYANRYIADSGWGTAVKIETVDGDVNDPQIAVDSSGNAIAVWEQSTGPCFSLRGNLYTAGIGWGTAVLLETDDSGDVDQPQVSFDPDGNAIAVWHQSNGSIFSIWANRYTAGGGWEGAELLETDDSGDAYDAQVAFDLSGNAIAVWEQGYGGYYSIWANLYTAGTGWGTPVPVETETGDTWNPRIAFDSFGNAVAVWSQSNGTSFSIRANRYTAGTGWGTAEPIGTASGDAWLPKVATDVYGNAVTVWRQDNGGRFDIYSNYYTAGTGWQTAELVETDDSGDAGVPQLAADVLGNAMAVWKQFDGSRDNILAAHYR